MSVYRRLANFDAVPSIPHTAIRVRFVPPSRSTAKKLLGLPKKNKNKYGICTGCGKTVCMKVNGQLYVHSRPGTKKCEGSGTYPALMITSCIVCNTTTTYNRVSRIISEHHIDIVRCEASGLRAGINYLGVMISVTGL